jgi:thiamine biosynthesis lipoprotein ApbE
MKEKTKTYEVEFTSTTHRQYCVDAKNKTEAEEKAWEELEMDTEVSSAWVENSKVERIANTATENTWMNVNGKLED